MSATVTWLCMSVGVMGGSANAFGKSQLKAHHSETEI